MFGIIISVIVLITMGYLILKNYKPQVVLAAAGIFLMMCGVWLGFGGVLDPAKSSGYLIVDIYNEILRMLSNRIAGLGLSIMAVGGYITKKNKLVDYGCGKGRVGFYLSYQTRCRSVGIEYDERIFQDAESNRERSVSGRRTEFECRNGESYQPPADADRFYFFNPFSVELFRKVLGRIRSSYYENPREILLFFYYPSDEYVAFLMTGELTFLDEIDCRDLFSGDDERERILIFKMDDQEVGQQ